MCSFALRFPEDGKLTAKTSTGVQAYVQLSISVMCIHWYHWMITEAMQEMNNIKTDERFSHKY